MFAYLNDITHLHLNGLQSVSLNSSDNTLNKRNPPQITQEDNETTTHHIIAYYRSTAVLTCSRCHKQFFRTPSLNSCKGCRFHSGYFVCRWHPAEIRQSCGQGDSLGYYGTGEEGYEAKFWDCCGSEDPTHPGCKFDKHIAY